MKKIFIAVMSLIVLLPMMEKSCEASHKLDDLIPDKGYGPTSRANFDAIKRQFDIMQAHNDALQARNQTLATQNSNLFDLLSTQQKEFIGLSIATGVIGFVSGYFLGYDAGYEMGYSVGLGAATPTLCAIAKPVINTVYRNITQFLPCNATEVVYLQPEHILLDAQPMRTVRQSLIGMLLFKITG